MLVSELKETLKKYSQEELMKLIAEMYKAMPKKLREDKDIDQMIQDIGSYMCIDKALNKKENIAGINDLKPEIEQFINYAYNQYYFAPNSFVHKKERPKWRFKVKAYIKDLQSITPQGEEGSTATDLLKRLYEMLSYACGFYIFSTDDPFRSVGIEQVDLLHTIISRMFAQSIDKESVRSAIELVINNHLGREALYSDLIMELIESLKTADAKEIAIEQCKALKHELNEPKPVTKKKSWQTDSTDYASERRNNNLVEMVSRSYMALCEYEEAIEYFRDNHVERYKEIALYVLLRLLFEYNLKDYWIREYNRAVSQGVKPRDALQKMYSFIKENDRMPEYIPF